MVMPFNMMNVDISCLGNHETDMDLPKAKELIAKTNCPWIMTNLLQKSLGSKPMLGLEPFHVMEHKNFKYGFLGFAEEEWIDTLIPEIDANDIEYLDYNETL